MSHNSQRQTASHISQPTDWTFLLRCWREEGVGPDDVASWRFCLAKPGNRGTERAFASLEALTAYLRKELEAG